MRFVHISDTHVGPTPDSASEGRSPYASLEHLVEAINSLTFPVDFVLHTGDVANMAQEAEYATAAPLLARLHMPVYYAAGNHDNPVHMRRILLGQRASAARFDYQFEAAGVHFAVFDTRGPADPSGRLEPDQLEALRRLCTPDGPPLVIALHHPPLPLDAAWIDQGWVTRNGTFPNMLLENGEAFYEAVAPARARLCGVFCGHVHRAYQAFHQGVLLSSAPSSFVQFFTWPDQALPVRSPDELPGFSLVTIEHGRTVVRSHHLNL